MASIVRLHLSIIFRIFQTLESSVLEAPAHQHCLRLRLRRSLRCQLVRWYSLVFHIPPELSCPLPVPDLLYPLGRHLCSRLARLDPAAFEKCLFSWVQAVQEVTENLLVSIFSKTVRGSSDQ